ncbi:MAG TPA: potassium transporter TrkG [Bacteroidales bacterium]|nr:potassium transporter TrkG [Bacteroidales bacterium]
MPSTKVDRFREYINIRLYRHKAYVIGTLQILSVLVALVALSSIIYYYGFPKTAHSYQLNYWIMEGSFIFYFVKFIVKIFYDFHPVDFIKNNLFEALIMLSLLLDGIGMLLFGEHIVILFFNLAGLPKLSEYFIVFVQLYFFVFVALEVGKAGEHLSLLKMGPSAMLALSFIILILGGSGLLYLPEMTYQGIRYIDALFTSTSACCVTGLTAVDTAKCFTVKGQMIIMLLIQLGGINIISFAAFFATFSSSSAGLRYQSLIKELASTNQLSDTRSMLRRIILYSLSIELIGTILIFYSWPAEVNLGGFSEKLFFSLFHSVSAYNNAGFALFTDNLYDVGIRHSYNLQLIIASLIFLGGIGIIVLEDMFSLTRIRERSQLKWKKLTVHSKVALRSSVALIIAGAIVFYFVERNNTIKDYGYYGAIVSSIFQSVTCRTAGFNSVDFSHLGQPVLMFMIFLMFVGASPASTGGGIKTTTFATIVASAYATIRNKKNVEMLRHTVSFELIDKAYSIALFSVSLIFISTFFLSITDGNHPFLKLIFEEVSAFGTVGLSTGITPLLSDAGKTILILTMYVGRIGTLTLALALMRKAAYTKYKYSQISLVIG